MDRDQAFGIVCEFVKSESLRKHMLAVEVCVTAYARKFGEDEQKWGVTALLHDFGKVGVREEVLGDGVVAGRGLEMGAVVPVVLNVVGDAVGDDCEVTSSGVRLVVGCGWLNCAGGV